MTKTKMLMLYLFACALNPIVIFVVAESLIPETRPSWGPDVELEIPGWLIEPRAYDEMRDWM